MHYRLRENLSCCDVNGHMIFLDISQDRYFRLTGPLEGAMRRFLAHESVSYTLLEHLATTRILTETSDQEAHTAIANIPRPTCSAIEQPIVSAGSRLSLAMVFEVMATIWLTQRQLKIRTLETNLDVANVYRCRKAGTGGVATTAAREVDLLKANWQFARARRYVPIEPICLLDSLSLLRFLSRRGLSANIVFGVTSEPFAAHCWVQAGDMVLNETLSDAVAHTPIRMI